ncbi:TonB-dependent receptor [Acidicapsa ligni]|uniref:TonB-dependent receptor n=1 Tax=Acidicapsa ligni TaxID=542300 RepID=UPI0021DFDF61|nr:carboxypeptidase regulatory-like domain-containing protein [Acidicapsa ligni]
MSLVLLVAVAPGVYAQSTYGTILGTVHDSSGASVPGAKVILLNTGTAAQRVVASDASGNFTFSNIDVGTYSITITAAGFEKYVSPGVSLTARESRRLDPMLQLGAENQTVTVVAQAQNVITTEVSNLAETKVGEELVSLPVAIYSRSTGSTSPISTLTTEAGVQTDDSGNLSVMGTTPALLSVTVDGISSVGVEYSGPINEMFPSFNSIEEIRVSESNNNAEFSGVADITTISKAGTNKYHGGVFENIENTVFNAGDPFTGETPKIVMNDFGGTLGGPMTIPHLYQGKDRTFFFISYEGLRLPRETPIVASVPTLAMRGNGTGFADLTSYLQGQGITNIYQPDGITPVDPSRVPINPISANMLKYLMPAPNYGSADSYVNNFRENFPSPISTNQGDVRLDHTISQKQSVFARFSYKNRQVTSAPDTTCTYSFCQSAGSPLQGAYNIPEIDEGLTFAHNYVFTPKLLNEFRGGFNAQHTSTNQSYSTSQLLQQTGLSVPQPNLDWAEAPQLIINGFMATGGGNPTVQRSQIVQLLDNVTWTKGHHTFKFGGDWKRLTDFDTNVFGNYSSGWYVFDGSSDVGANIGEPYTSFLQGFPDYTEAATINKSEMDGVGYSYAVFAQDDWKVTSNLTLNLGLRWELHPPLKEIQYNTAFFLPDYSGAGTDGSPVTGAVVVPNAKAIGFESNDFINAIAPTPTLTAKQAGLPETLRYTDKHDWGPRLGFAWRPYGNDKTVVRGGWGRFIETPLGFSLVSGWAVSASYVGVFNQDFQADGVTPQLSFSNPFPPQTPGSATGTAGFYYAFPIHYKDPSVQQWNLTVEQDLGHGIGMRLSYTANHGTNLETMVDLNQVPANTTGYYNNESSASSNECITDGGLTVADHRPYPCWSVIQSVENLAESNYNSGTVEVSRHSGKGLTFNASYVFTRDISDAAGATPAGFVSSGGNFLTDRFHPGLDYGNVAYDRRHRFLATYLYDLPFGKGQRWLSTGSALNAMVGDWHLGGVTVLQSGPFLTPYQATSDPAGTNILTTVGQTHADIVPGQSLYATHRNINQWLNPNAYAIPAANRGYFGTASVGSVVGPGTDVFSLSLRKDLAIGERARFEFSAEAANVFNHRNYEPPNMQLDSGAFGAIPELQTAEGAGPRNLQLTGRITF